MKHKTLLVYVPCLEGGCEDVGRIDLAGHTLVSDERLWDLEAAESARRDDYQNWMTALDRNAELIGRLEDAEKDIALKERVIDALGSTLNAVFNERDALRTVLTDLLNDLEERAKWNLEESQRVVACGNGVYMRAKAALEETK